MVLRSSDVSQHSERKPKETSPPSQASEFVSESSCMPGIAAIGEERQVATDLLSNELTRGSEETLWPAAR